VGKSLGLAVVGLPFPIIKRIHILKETFEILERPIYLCALEAESVRAGEIFGLERLVIKSVVTDTTR